MTLIGIPIGDGARGAIRIEGPELETPVLVYRCWVDQISGLAGDRPSSTWSLDEVPVMWYWEANAMTEAVSADVALRLLVEGNERFQRGAARYTGMRPADLETLAKGQRPFATILGCSDSRVPPELIFDSVLGELFVIRVAGNVLSSEIAGSMQYAGEHLRTPLFVVLGHSGCGAVHATLDYVSTGVKQLSRIQLLVDSILPGLGDIDAAVSKDDQLAAAVEANVRWTMRQILQTEAGERVAAGEFKLVGGVYDLATGAVRFIEAV